MEPLILQTASEDAGKRLDAWLAEQTELTRSAVQKLMEEGRVTAAEVLGKLALLAGFNPSAEPKTAEQLLADFDWAKVPREDIRLPEGLF